MPTARALERIGAAEIDLVLLDHKLPDGDGLTVLRKMKGAAPDIQVILMTGQVSAEQAVEAMKLGAYHHVNKPFNLDEVEMLVHKALEISQLRREVHALRTSQGREYFLEEKTFKREGSPADMRVDVRVIAATNRALEQEVGSGRFREDLFYRLQALSIALPPLRERHGDIPLPSNGRCCSASRSGCSRATSRR